MVTDPSVPRARRASMAPAPAIPSLALRGAAPRVFASNAQPSTAAWRVVCAWPAMPRGRTTARLRACANAVRNRRAQPGSVAWMVPVPVTPSPARMVAAGEPSAWRPAWRAVALRVDCAVDATSSCLIPAWRMGGVPAEVRARAFREPGAWREHACAHLCPAPTGAVRMAHALQLQWLRAERRAAPAWRAVRGRTAVAPTECACAAWEHRASMVSGA